MTWGSLKCSFPCRHVSLISDDVFTCVLQLSEDCRVERWVSASRGMSSWWKYSYMLDPNNSCGSHPSSSEALRGDSDGRGWRKYLCNLLTIHLPQTRNTQNNGNGYPWLNLQLLIFWLVRQPHLPLVNEDKLAITSVFGDEIYGLWWNGTAKACSLLCPWGQKGLVDSTHCHLHGYNTTKSQQR